MFHHVLRYYCTAQTTAAEAALLAGVCYVLGGKTKVPVRKNEIGRVTE